MLRKKKKNVNLIIEQKPTLNCDSNHFVSSGFRNLFFDPASTYIVKIESES